MSYALVKLVKPVSASCFIRETISNGSRIREGEIKIRQDILFKRHDVCMECAIPHANCAKSHRFERGQESLIREASGN